MSVYVCAFLCFSWKMDMDKSSNFPGTWRCPLLSLIFQHPRMTGGGQGDGVVCVCFSLLNNTIKNRVSQSSDLPQTHCVAEDDLARLMLPSAAITDSGHSADGEAETWGQKSGLGGVLSSHWCLMLAEQFPITPHPEVG